MLKKLVIGMMIVVSSMLAGTVGAGSDGKLWNKAYLDVYFGDDVEYHYVNYNGNGFELQTRTLQKIWDLYRKRKTPAGKIKIASKIALPDDIEDEFTFIIKNDPSVFITRSYPPIVLKINNVRPKNQRQKFPVLKNNMGEKYADIKIETSGLIHGDDFKHKVKYLSELQFYIYYKGKAKRGVTSQSKELPIKIYSMDE